MWGSTTLHKSLHAIHKDSHNQQLTHGYAQLAESIINAMHTPAVQTYVETYKHLSVWYLWSAQGRPKQSCCRSIYFPRRWQHCSVGPLNMAARKRLPFREGRPPPCLFWNNWGPVRAAIDIHEYVYTCTQTHTLTLSQSRTVPIRSWMFSLQNLRFDSWCEGLGRSGKFRQTCNFRPVIVACQCSFMVPSCKTQN